MTSKPEDVDEEQDDLASGPQSTRLANDLRGVRRLAGWGSGDGEQTGEGPPNAAQSGGSRMRGPAAGVRWAAGGRGVQSGAFPESALVMDSG